MKFSLFSKHFAILLFFSLASFGVGEVANAKFTVCTVTINSDNEAKLFKSKLSNSEFEFIEIVPEKDKGGQESSSIMGTPKEVLSGKNRRTEEPKNRGSSRLVVGK